MLKIVAAWMGLHIAIGLGVANVYLEGDSSYAISTMTTLQMQRNQDHHL